MKIKLPSFLKSLNFWLAIGTWGLVATSIWNTNEVKEQMKKQSQSVSEASAEQLVELKKATELQWRPYLHIEQAAQGVRLYFGYPNDSGTDTLLKPIQSVNLSSKDFMKVISFHYSVPTILTYYNSGATPLNISLTFVGLLTKDEWFNLFEKSPERFVSSLPSHENIDKDIVDVAILPDSSFSSKRHEFIGSIDINKFNDMLKSDSTIVLYNCSYVEYKDFFENRYNALMIRHVKISLINENGVINYQDKIGTLNLEVYRWDVLLEEWGI